jgi:hypothetical protein
MSAQTNEEAEILPMVRSALTPMDMLDRAITSGAGIEVLTKLMDLQERWDKTQARKAFDDALSAAKTEMPIIVKNRQVDFGAKVSGKSSTNYKHEDLAEIARTVDPILGKHGLSYRFRTTSLPNEPVTVTCIVSHRLGHSEENTLCAGRDDTGNKNGIQALGSTLTYLQRYALKAALGLAASNDDDGMAAGNGGERLKSVYASKPIAAEIKAAFLACKSIDQLFALGDEKSPIIGTLNVLCQDDIRETFATHRKNLRIDGKYHGQPASEPAETVDPETGEVTDQVIWTEDGERPATAEEIADSVRSPLNRDVHPHKPDALEGAKIPARQVMNTGDSRERPAPDPLDIPDGLKRLTPKEEALWLDLLRSAAAAAPDVQTMMDLQAEHMGATMQRKVSPRVWLDGVTIFRERVQWLTDNPVFDAETWLVGDLAGALSGAETPLQLAQVKDRMLIPRKDELTPDQWRVAVKMYRGRLDEISPENILGG